MASHDAAQDPIWTTGIDAARKRGRKVRVLLLSLFAIQLIGALFQGWRGLLLFGVDLAVFAIVAAHALRVPPATSLVELSDSQPSHAALLADIHELARQVDVRMSGVPVLINRANLGASPCVRSRERPRFLGLGTSEPMLEIPVGFLQIYQRERPAALAVLAHELTHIRHRDWESWAFTSAAASVIKWIRLPVAFAMALWAAAGLFDYAPAYLAIEHAVDNARDYAEIFADQKAERVRNPMPPDVMTLMNPNLARARLEMDRTPDEQLFALQGQLAEAAIMSATLLLTPLLSLLLLHWILRLRKATEIAADRIAALTASPGAMRRALTMFDTGRPRWQWLSAHPSVQSRLAALATLDTATGSVVPDASSQQQADRVRKRTMSSPGALRKWLRPANRRPGLQRTVLFSLPLVLGGIGSHVATRYLSAAGTSAGMNDSAPSLLGVLVESVDDTEVLIALGIGAAIAIIVLACLSYVRSIWVGSLIAALASGFAAAWLERMAFVYWLAPEVSLAPEAVDPLIILRQASLTALPLLVFLLAFDRMLARHAPLPAYTLATTCSIAAYWLVVIADPTAWPPVVPQFSDMFSRGVGEAAARLMTFVVCNFVLWLPLPRHAAPPKRPA